MSFEFALTYLLTHLRSWALLEKLPIVQPLKNFPTFYETRRLITVFTRAPQCSLSWARSIQSIPSHTISLRSILILSTHLHLGLPSGLFPSGFPANILYAFLLSPHSCYKPRPSHPPWIWSCTIYENNHLPRYVVVSCRKGLQIFWGKLLPSTSVALCVLLASFWLLTWFIIRHWRWN
jgi:hypothetical protein